MEVISEKENKLFNRKEIQLNIEAEVTPSHDEAKKLISEKFSTQPENIRIKKIAGKFGSKVFGISANIYSSEEDKNKIEVFSKKEAEREKKPEPVEELVEEESKETIETSEEKTEEESKEEAPLEKEQKVSNEIAEKESKEENTEGQVEEAKEEIKEKTEEVKKETNQKENVQ